MADIQSSSSSMPRLILFNARPWKVRSPVTRRPVQVVRLWIQLQNLCVEKALPRTEISEALATCKDTTTDLCCAIELASVLVSGNPLRSDFFSSSKDRVLRLLVRKVARLGLHCGGRAPR